MRNTSFVACTEVTAIQMDFVVSACIVDFVNYGTNTTSFLGIRHAVTSFGMFDWNRCFDKI